MWDVRQQVLRGTPEMKIVLCTTPIRPVPTDYPPFGSMALVQSLRRQAGYDPYFYNIDGLRPSFDDVIRFFTTYQPDLIGISAVVSTAYTYTKALCQVLKQVLPQTPIIVGGNLAASAELLLRRCGVDLCGIGEGEHTIVRVARALQAMGGRVKRDALREIKNLAFLDERGDMVFTGYDLPIPAEEFLDPDYAILERDGLLNHYITDPLNRADFAQDPRTYQPHRRGQKMATVVSAKGCVARCTFCHRWDKGYRHLPPATIVRRMRHLRERYNVGFFMFGDENFGSDRRRLEELIALIKPMDILYQVGGVRCRSIDRELLLHLKESGCVALYYGMETGSPRMLEVMEKNATLAHNLQAAFWTHEVGLYTTYQLVLGMPGENGETIDETIEFVKKITEILPDPPCKKLSVNYIQALPGTPTYEHARQRGLLGASMDEEEAYLLRISDIDAADDSKFLNFTNDDYFTVQSWRVKILFEAQAHWYRLRDWKAPDPHSPAGRPVEEKDYDRQGGYFNIKKLVFHPWFYRYGYPFRSLYYALHVLAKDVFRLPQKDFWGYVGQWIRYRIARQQARFADYRSLRRIVAERVSVRTPSEAGMLPLRQGR